MLDLLALTFGRLVLNMTRRFPYPFLPEISRQLSVPLESVQGVMASYAGIGVASPLLGPIGERFGRRRVLLAGLLLLIAAGTVAALLPQFGVFALMMLGMGVAKMVYDPAMAAYIADHVPYQRRGRVVGITELSWALSLLLAAPLAGFLLGSTGLPGVFAVLTLLGVGALLLIARYIPADHDSGHLLGTITPLATWRALRQRPSSFGALAYTLLLVIANEIFFINYAAHMESTFGLALTALGTVSIVIALGEVFGEFVVIALADRFGKRRVALIGVLVSALGYGVMPLFSFSLPLTLAALFVIFCAIEAAVVASIPLFTEVLPQARAIMVSSNIGAASLGRLTGALLGGFLFANLGSFAQIGLLAAGVGLAALLLLWRFLHEYVPAA